MAREFYDRNAAYISDNPQMNKKNGIIPCSSREKLYLCTRKNGKTPNILCTSVLVDTDASLAQLVEQLTLNQWVQGSSP